MGASYFRRHRPSYRSYSAVMPFWLQWGPPISGGIGCGVPRPRIGPRPAGFNGGLLFQEASDGDDVARLHVAGLQWGPPISGGIGHDGHAVDGHTGHAGASMGASYFRRHRRRPPGTIARSRGRLQWGPPISGGIGRGTPGRRTQPTNRFNGGLLFQEASADAGHNAGLQGVAASMGASYFRRHRGPTWKAALTSTVARRREHWWHPGCSLRFALELGISMSR